MRKILLGGLLILAISGVAYTTQPVQRLIKQKSAPPVAKTAPTIQRDPNQYDVLDVEYAKKKILHHQLAAILADKAKTDAIRPEVRKLAEQISVEETARANVYITMLTEWNESYDNITDFPEVNGCHGYPTFSGMLPYQEVGKYRLSTGEDVDKTFFEIMIAHHDGNKELAEIEGRHVAYGKLITLRDASLREYDEQGKQLAATQQALGL